jgi:hypothetical protein
VASWNGGDTEPAGECTFVYRKGNENHELGTGFLVHKGNISVVNRVEFVSHRISYTIARGRWSHVIALEVHDPKEKKFMA